MPAYFFMFASHADLHLKRKKVTVVYFALMARFLAHPFKRTHPIHANQKVTVVDKDNKPSPNHWGWLILFASTSTLLCCALPILLVSLGMGAVVAAMASNFPLLITLSQHKIWIFAGCFALLLIAAWALYRPGRACPTDPQLAAKCASAHKWNKRFFCCSVMVWLLGFFSAYILQYL